MSFPIFTKKAIKGIKLTDHDFNMVHKRYIASRSRLFSFKPRLRTEDIREETLMAAQCRHIPVEKAAGLLQKRLKAIGFEKIDVEDDEPDFKHFFAKSRRLFEDAFFTIEILLYELRYDDGAGAGIEFHVLFFTKKGRRLQRSLSRNGFERLRTFLDVQLFEPSGLKAVEYDSPVPSDRDYKRRESWTWAFPGNIPGVLIHVGGWLCKKA